ncbi:MAG: type 4a pilus biogenesis protein PilO [Phycisphaeraceae bacterium]|nr:type 4a pilus biogenesis protein PilO [Phycisphaeraceae bacterium]
MRIESDIIKTVVVIAALVGTYAGVVFWPSQKQNQALADEILNKQTELEQAPRPNLEPVRGEIASLRAELRERSVVLPKGNLHDRVLHHVSDTLIQRGVTLYETSYRQTKAFKRFSMTPIDVRFETDFVNAFEIIKQIENAGPPVRIERMDIVGSEGDASGQVEVTLELSSFFERDQGGQR